MDKKKKALMIWFGYFSLVALYFTGIGYSLGKSKQKELIKAFAFPIPDDFTSDEVAYFMDEIMDELRKRDFAVSQKEINALHSGILLKTMNSRSMADGLFQNLGDES